MIRSPISTHNDLVEAFGFRRALVTSVGSRIAMEFPMSRLSKLLFDAKASYGFSREICRAIRSGMPLPQDLLYRVPEGADLWERLRSDVDGPLGRVYRQFRDSDACQRAVEMLLEQEVTSVRARRPLTGVIIVGCGDSSREASLCQHLINRKAGLKKVAYIDLSSNLLKKATLELERLHPPCKLIAGQFSFEETGTLKLFRHSEFGDGRVAFFFIGNTLGNLDERQMLAELSGAMIPGDRLLVEVLTHLYSASRNTRSEQIAGSDPRAAFVLNPLRLLGIRPRAEQLAVVMQNEAQSGRQTTQYEYKFSNDESGLIQIPGGPEVTIVEGSRLVLLQVKSMSVDYLSALMCEQFETVETYTHTYSSGSNDVLLTYAVAHGVPDRQPTESPDTTPLGALTSLDAWSGVSVGVNESDFFAVPGLLDDGANFPMREAKRLIVPRGKLQVLMRLLAESPTGKKVDKHQTFATLYPEMQTALRGADSNAARREGLRLVKTNQPSTKIAELSRSFRAMMEKNGFRADESRVFSYDNGEVFSLVRFGAILRNERGCCFFRNVPEQKRGDL